MSRFGRFHILESTLEWVFGSTGFGCLEVGLDVWIEPQSNSSETSISTTKWRACQAVSVMASKPLCEKRVCPCRWGRRRLERSALAVPCRSFSVRHSFPMQPRCDHCNSADRNFWHASRKQGLCAQSNMNSRQCDI